MVFIQYSHSDDKDFNPNDLLPPPSVSLSEFNKVKERCNQFESTVYPKLSELKEMILESSGSMIQKDVVIEQVNSTFEGHELLEKMKKKVKIAEEKVEALEKKLLDVNQTSDNKADQLRLDFITLQKD